MKVGYLYQKGKSYFYCRDFDTQKGGSAYGDTIKNNGTIIQDDVIFCEDINKYTEIGKAIDIIKRGIK